MLRRPSVINTNPLAGSQWRCHSLASCVNNVRGRAESETYRPLLAPHDDRLTRFIGSYRPRLVSRACSRLCCCWSRRCCCFFGRGRAGLCKRQWRNQPADQSNDCSFHYDSSFLIRFTSTVRGSRLKRTLFVRLSLHSRGTAAIRHICDFTDLSGRCEFGNMGH